MLVQTPSARRSGHLEGVVPAHSAVAVVAVATIRAIGLKIGLVVRRRGRRRRAAGLGHVVAPRGALDPSFRIVSAALSGFFYHGKNGLVL